MLTIITGASTGIGFSFAQALIHQDEHLLLISQNPTRLNEAKKKLLSIRPGFKKLDTLAVDLSKEEVSKITDWLDKKKLSVTTLINNAGLGYLGEFSQMSPSKILEIINVNTIALTILTQEIIKRMDSGRIINIASVVGFTPTPLMNIYGASKAYVLSFSLGLEEELKHSSKNIQVYTVCPGTTKTPFFDRAGEDNSVNRDKGIFKFNRSMEPSQVVEETLKAIEKKKTLVIPGAINKFLVILTKWLPRAIVIKVNYYLMKSGIKD